MPADQPFLANVQSGTAGFTKSIAPVTASSTNVSISSSTSGYAPTLLVTNIGSNVSYIRMSSEASATATTTDTPMLGNTVRLFANPAPNGSASVAVICTASGNTVYFTPGQAGVF